jgi:hypothetical protein
MKVHDYKEREDGGADIAVELESDEARTLIEVGLIKVLKDFTEEHEKHECLGVGKCKDQGCPAHYATVGDKDHWVNRMDEDE